MNSAQAIQSFWGGFGWSAYDQHSVPDNAILPYVTYDVVTDEFDSKAMSSGNLFDKSTSWAKLSEKLEEISNAIGHGGKVIKTDKGAIWITKGTPFARRSSENDTIKQIIINIQTEFIE